MSRRVATHSATQLVVIDPKKLIYKRFVGKRLDVKVRSEEPMLAEEIELLRVRPDLLLPTEPELA